MPYLTTRRKPKATTKPWFSRLLRHPARKRSGSILGHNTHPGATRGDSSREFKTLRLLDIWHGLQQSAVDSATDEWRLASLRTGQRQTF